MNKPLVSVIVPIYNTGINLKFLVDSIIAQTFKDFELLLIDDGSTDDVTPPLCDEYGAVDSRIRVFHKQNGGVSDSRNYGIDNAKGTFIAFADHDDYMFPDNLQTMVEEIGDRELLICSYIGGLRENIRTCKRNNKKTREVVAESEGEMADTIPRIGYKHHVVWNQLYRLDSIKKYHVRFIKIQSEDEMFSFTYLSHVHSLKFIDYQGYYFVDTPHSQGSSHKYIVEMNWISQMECIYEEMERKYPPKEDFKRTVNFRLAIRLASLCLKGYHSDSLSSFSKRMDTWNDVRCDRWLLERIELSKLPIKMGILLFVARWRLFYILDPFFMVMIRWGENR